MGYVEHNAIVVTTWKDEILDAATARAIQIGLEVIGPSTTSINGYRSILVCPDGRKEGWDASDVGDRKRTEFTAWLNSQAYGDGSTCLDWVEVSFGSDDRGAAIVRDAWHPEMEEKSSESPGE
jgi:hypothetical protein